MTVPTTGYDVPAPASEGQSTRKERVGWYFYDWANSAFSTTVISVFLGPYLGHIAENAAHCPTINDAGDVDCTGRLLHPLGIPVAPGSVYAYALSLSVILQVLVLPVAGAIADRSSHKKQLLALFAYIGSGSTIGLLFLTGERYLLGAGLFILANVAFGASVVVYNSFLPQIAPPDRRDSVSSLGFAVGYIGGGLLLLLNLVAVIIWKDSVGKAELARWSIVSAGVWWAAFTTLPLLGLTNRAAVAGEHGGGSAITDGFKQLGRTLRNIKTYRLSMFFLIAYLIYNDGIQTVISVASVYADKQLGLTQDVQLQTILLVQFVAFGGAMLLGRLARSFGAKKTVLGSLLVWIGVVVAAYFLPAHQPLAFMALGLLLGLVLGGSQALSRSLFSQLIPHGKEAEYFGIYEISDKGTSWLGPLVFGITYQVTGRYDLAIISLFIFFVVGFLALLAIPMKKAIEAAGNTPPKVI